MTAERNFEALFNCALRQDLAAVRDLVDLVERALANPDRTVAAAFGLRRRGGKPARRTELRRERDSALRAFAQTQFDGMSLGSSHGIFGANFCGRGRAPNAATGELLRRIAASGLPIPRPRHMMKILKQS
jgi:hypothetical protein